MSIPKIQPQMGKARKRVPESVPDRTAAPTVGDVKRALHDLARQSSLPGYLGSGASLREAHELLHRLALREGIDPAAAIRQRLDAVQALRERLVVASIAAAGQNSR